MDEPAVPPSTDDQRPRSWPYWARGLPARCCATRTISSVVDADHLHRACRTPALKRTVTSVSPTCTRTDAARRNTHVVGGSPSTNRSRSHHRVAASGGQRWRCGTRRLAPTVSSAPHGLSPCARASVPVDDPRGDNVTEHVRVRPRRSRDGPGHGRRPALIDPLKRGRDIAPRWLLAALPLAPGRPLATDKA